MNVILYQKMIFYLLFVHSYLSFVTSFFNIKLFRLDLRNFIQVWWAPLTYKKSTCTTHQNNTCVWLTVESFNFVGVNFRSLSNFYRFVGTLFRGSVGWEEVRKLRESLFLFETSYLSIQWLLKSLNDDDAGIAAQVEL